jgi:hypothetical protein
MPTTVAVRSEAWTIFARLNTGVMSSNRIWGVDVCARLFFVKVAPLRQADPPSKESCRLYVGSRNWKSGQGPKGCRAVEGRTPIIQIN